MTNCCDLCIDARIDGALNFRDLGGHAAGAMRVRRGLLYRAAMTHGITAGGLRVLAEDHDLRTVIDLRSDQEIAELGTAPFQAAGVAYHHSPVTSSAATPPEVVARYRQEMRAGTFDWSASYVRMIERAGPAFRRVFDLLARPGALPAVFHCVAGRDRTGVASALVLGTLGVSTDDIAADYALTGVHLRPHAHRFTHEAARLELTSAQMVYLLDTEATVMHRFLDHIQQRYGSVPALVRSLGVDERTLTALAAALLEPAA